MLDCGNAPFTIMIDTTGMTAGLHQVSVEAYDQAGNVAKQQAAFVLK